MTNINTWRINNNISYIASGYKSNGVWTLGITFWDTYDFDYKDWSEALSGNAAGVALNNYGVYAQSIGAVVPYEVKVTVQTTF